MEYRDIIAEIEAECCAGYGESQLEIRQRKMQDMVAEHERASKVNGRDIVRCADRW